jgi:ComEC/Rec2-related protein
VLWKPLLYVFIALLSSLNTTQHAPLSAAKKEQKAVFHGTVLTERVHAQYTTLLILIHKVDVNGITYDCTLPVEYNLRKRGVFVGKKVAVSGRLVAAQEQHRSQRLIGTLVMTGLPQSVAGRIVYSIREYIHTTLFRVFRQEHSALASGLILGGSGYFDDELKDVFSSAGVLHIFAVSGLHVGFVCLFVGAVLMFAPVSLRIKFVLTMAILLVYAAVTGFRPSVCRATLMAFLFGLCFVLQRNVDSVHVVSIAAIIFLVVNPLLLFDVSAQLSFAAVYGIVTLYPVLDARFMSRFSKKIRRFILAPLAVSFSAQLFVSPLLVFYFHRLPTLATLSNCVIVPLVSVVIFLIFSCLFCGLFSLAVAQGIAFAIAPLLTLLVVISRSIARIPFSTVTLFVSPVLLLLAYGLIIGKTRRACVYAVLFAGILFSVASFSDCVIVRATEGSSVVTVPTGKHVFLTKKGSFVQSTKFLNILQTDRYDFVLAPDDVYPKKRSYLKYPEELRVQHITLDNVEMRVDDELNVRYGDTEIRIEHDLSNGSEGLQTIRYYLSNGDRIIRFETLFTGSILDQAVAELKLVISRIMLLW